MTNNGPCPYVCGNKSAFGYCLTTVCVNPLFKRKYEETQRFLGEYVKIVRCKDCKHMFTDFVMDGKEYKRCEMQMVGFHDDWFCADGERKSDDGVDS